jgi:CRP/FNR family transcriptional regulator
MISNPAHQQQLIESFDFLRQADPAFHHAFFEAATLVHVPQGHTIAEEGSECTQLALLVDGSVRVYKLAAKGREITLYRIKRGDSCVLTASCVMSHTPFPAIAEAETDLNAVVIPARFVRDWVSQSQAWSGFVFSLVSRRLADVITVLESVTFLRLDVRVAADLGSSREVVSRTLKTFAKHGWIQMGRGELTILDRPHLQELAESEEL